VPSPNEPIVAARLSLTIDGYEIASFSKLTRMTSEVAYDEAGKPRPGSARVLVVLERSMTRGTELAAWHQAAYSGAPARKSCILVAYGRDSAPAVKYLLHEALPLTLEVAGFAVDGTQQIAETLTLHCERVERVSP
jgi:hypothetical protein